MPVSSAVYLSPNFQWPKIELPKLSDIHPIKAAKDAYETTKKKVVGAVEDEMATVGLVVALNRIYVNYQSGTIERARGVELIHQFNKALDARMSAKDEPIVFGKELKALLVSPGAIGYLVSLKAAIANADATGTTLDLWKFTLDNCGGNRNQALKYIAVLFQDITESQAHVEYAQKNNFGTATGRQLLADVNTQLLESKHVQMYPGALKGVKTSIALYHFYVMAHVSQLTGEKEKSHKSAVAAAAFAFNNLYEYQKWGAFKLPPIKATVDGVKQDVDAVKKLSDPATFNQVNTDEDLLDDVYMGYVGALFGVGKEGEALDRATFAKEFSKGPEAFIEKHFTFY